MEYGLPFTIYDFNDLNDLNDLLSMTLNLAALDILDTSVHFWTTKEISYEDQENTAGPRCRG